MIGAKVVDRTNQIHSIVQRGDLTSQRTPAADQSRNPRPESGVQPLNEGGIDHSTFLCLVQQGFDLAAHSLYHPSYHAYHTFPGILFDHLRDKDTIPRSQAGPSGLPGRDRFPECLTNGINVRHATVYTEQQRATQSTIAYLLHQCPHQVLVATLTQHPTQPQTCLNLHCHSHPYNETLHLDPDFIGLYLSQVAWLFYQVFMYLLAVLARPTLPTLHRAFVQAKRHNDGLKRTPMSQKGDHNDHHILCRPQPVESGAFACGECLATDVADVPTVFLTVHTDVTFADLPSCGTGGIVAKYGLWVHWFASWSDLAVRL